MTTMQTTTDVANLAPGTPAPYAREPQDRSVLALTFVRAKCGSCGLALSTYPTSDFPPAVPAHGLTHADIAALEPGAPAPHAREAAPSRGPRCRACGVTGRVRLVPLS